LSQGMLTGKALTAFINRSVEYRLTKLKKGNFKIDTESMTKKLVIVFFCYSENSFIDSCRLTWNQGDNYTNKCSEKHQCA